MRNNIIVQRLLAYTEKIASDDLEVKIYLKETIKEIVVDNEDVQIKLNIA